MPAKNHKAKASKALKAKPNSGRSVIARTAPKRPRAVKELRTIQDLTPDRSNVNLGTERGNYMIDWAVTNLGAGRSVLADRAGNIIAGNKTLEIAAEHGLQIEVVKSDGKKLVVVQRTDLELGADGKDGQRARQMAIVDNRSQKVSYNEDAQMLLTHQASGIDISPMYRPDELKALTAAETPSGVQPVDYDGLWQGMPAFDQQGQKPYRTIIVHMETREHFERFAQAMEQTLTEKTKSIWFPYKPKEKISDHVVEASGK